MSVDLWAAMTVAGVLLIALLAFILSGNRLNPLFLVAGLYCVLAPISAARESALLGVAKVGRVSCTVLILSLGFLMLRRLRIGLAGAALASFGVLSALAGLYSESPASALQFKGLAAAVMGAGLMLAYSIRDLRDLERSVRVLVVASAVFGAVLAVEVALGGGAFSTAGRLEPWGLNANRTGHEAAAFLVISLALGLYDSRTRWRFFGLSAAAFFAVVVLASGSRASVALVLVAAGILYLPRMRRPAVVLGLVPLAFLAIWAALNLFEPEVTERLSDTTIDDRLMIWRNAIARLAASPLLGEGWLFTTEVRRAGSPMNLHNMYLQVLVEGGILLAPMFLFSLIAAQVRSLQLFWMLRRAHQGLLQYGYLPIALTAALMVHGIAESSTMLGSSVIALFFPFAIGLLDRFRRLFNDFSQPPR